MISESKPSYLEQKVIERRKIKPEEGTYIIKAKAKNICGNKSGWGTLSVTMPFSYDIPFQHFWERLFERFPHAFTFLRHLLGY